MLLENNQYLHGFFMLSIQQINSTPQSEALHDAVTIHTFLMHLLPVHAASFTPKNFHAHSKEKAE